MKSLLILEHEDGKLLHSMPKLVTAAMKLGTAIDAVAIGKDAAQIAQQAATISGINKIFTIEAPLAYPLAEVIAPLVHRQFGDYDYYLAAATSTGKDCMPRLAALLGIGQISDIIEVVDADTFKRPIYAGNAIATVKSNDKQKVLTVRVNAFDAAPASGTAAVEQITVDIPQTATALVEYQKTQSARPDLTAARVIIAGGRGIGSTENFKLLERIADKLGGAVGASRAAVDAGYAPNDWQIGQTGKIVAPDLYIALGISGAIQHLAGIKDSKVIVAVNKDENAAIFDIADYGLVADVFTVLPELEAQL